MVKMIQEGKVVALLPTSIKMDILKSGNLLHKQGFVDSQFGTTVGFTPSKSADLLRVQYSFLETVGWLMCTSRMLV